MRKLLISIVAACLLVPECGRLHAAAADPPCYRRLQTWHQSMLASLEALSRSEVADGFAAFESETMRGGEAARHVRLPLAGATELYLFVTGCPDVKWGVADWADARLLRQDGTGMPLQGATNCKVLLGRLETDLTLRSGLYQKIRIGDRQFDRGLNVQANSIVRVPLDEPFAAFEAWIGVDAWAGTNGSVRFSVLGPRSAVRKQLYELLTRDFPDGLTRQQINWEREDRILEFDWQPGDWRVLAERYASAAHQVPPLLAEALPLARGVRDREGFERVRELYYQSRRLSAALEAARGMNWTGLRLAIEDLERRFPARYPPEFRGRLAALESALSKAVAGGGPDRIADWETVERLWTEAQALKREALLANPLLECERLLVIKRKPIGDPRRSQWEGFGLGEYIGCPRQSSWANGTMPNIDQWDNEIAVLSPVRPEGKPTTLYRPPGRRLVTDVDLHWNADKLLFSMPDAANRWQIFELAVNSAGNARQLTPSHPDVHNYDAIYLPDGRINFISTAPLQGVPCNSGVIVGMMYQMTAGGGNLRQICFEQDHDYTPSVLNDGRVLYLRWDYTDTPHIWNRLLMSMNPDGSGQMEYYGANSYWPNAIFYARAIPGDPTKIVGIVTGHHEGRVGELVIFDPARGRHETNGVVQRIPGRGQPVEPKKEDKLTEHSWPKFLHPWPLSEDHFLVACKPGPDSLWGIYLADTWDNLVLVKEEEGFALLEPIPLQPRPKPPVIEDKIRPERADALVYMEDVYSGPGLRGVPRGTVKTLRLFTYHFGYQKLAGIDHRVGSDGPWETKRVLGTVPVEEDGSALFRVPARTPISLQPLDAQGKAVALMRSWMTAMPGETLSCVGCHDHASSAPAGSNRRLALRKAPVEIAPWRGPVRGFSFAREVQPVLDKHCVGCHDGGADRNQIGLPDLRRDQHGYVVYRHGQLNGEFVKGASKEALLGKYSAVFEPSYAVLRQYVRVGGLESDLHLLPAMEFHANTSELIQMLRKGHHGVCLDAEAWERLATWIDLNAPCHGRWAEVTKIPGNQCQRRLELRKLYGGVVENCEDAPEPEAAPVRFVAPERERDAGTAPAVAGWPFDAAQARRLQQSSGPLTRTVQLGGGVTLELVRIPAGQFAMGDSQGAPDEQPLNPARIERWFWLGRFEVSNEQFAQFDASHDSRFEHRTSWIFSEEYLGWPLNRPKQPVVRVSWQEAMAFCRWLGNKLGEEVTLPTEAQWEWACRAGSATPLSYGDLDTDFSRFANLGDASLRRLADEGWRPKSPDLVPRENRFNDGALVTVDAGRYAPNAWGLHDMHGNAAEWTRTTYKPYPYRVEDGRDLVTMAGEKVVRGGSWRDRPKHCRSGSRCCYQPWQKVYNVGFRVAIEPGKKTLASN